MLNTISMLDKIADGRTDLVFDFIAQGVPATTEAQGTSLIRWCAYYGDVSAIRFLLGHGENIQSLGENLDLNGACFHGHWRLTQFLIERGAQVNFALPETGETCLHAALSKMNRLKYTPIVRILLANGADPNRPANPSSETGSFMRDCRTKGETPLHRAAAFGNEEDVQLLLDAGANLEAKDANGNSPLSWASWYQRPGAILGKLAYADFHVNERRRRQTTCEPPTGLMDADLLGKPHL